MWICMRGKYVGVYKLKPAISIALLFLSWMESLYKIKASWCKNFCFFPRWQTEKKINIDLFEIAFTKLGKYDNIFGLKSHARLSSLLLCCLEKTILHPNCCKITTSK